MPPFAMAGNQDALQLSGITPVFAVGMHERGGGGKLSAGVSHAAAQLLTHTHYDDLTGVTTTPRGKQRDECGVQSKDKSDLLEAERIIRQQRELLNQRDLYAAAAHAEAKAVAAEEADRARAESDRGVDRERLLLQHRQDRASRV